LGGPLPFVGFSTTLGGMSLEALPDRLDSLRKLQWVTDAALAHLSLDELLSELLERVRDVLRADTSAVLLWDEEADELVARAAVGLEEEVTRGVRIPVGRGFAGRIAAERQPVTIEDVDHSDVVNPLFREKGVKSLLGAPLLARGRVLGVIHVGTLAPRVFTADDIELLEHAAERAALALDKALVHEELRRLDHLRDQFVSTAAHELRTPASAILGAAATLDTLAGRLDPEVEAQLKRMLHEQSLRLAELVDQLLDVSRLEARALALRLETFQIRDRLETIVSAVADDGSKVDVDVASDLVVEADPVAFDRIVSNLVLNALRHGAPPVLVSARVEDSRVRVVVEDRGEGVPREFRSRLFEQFARSKSSAGKPGTGLGLAIARAFARAHGGDVVYQDARPRGARFELFLPRSA
jgi:signal transduction histidine kinase